MAAKISFVCVLLLAAVIVQGRRLSKGSIERKQHLQRNDEYFHARAQQKRGTWYMRMDKAWKECFFTEYAPNGKVKAVGKIKAPKATVDSKNAIEKIIGKAGKVGTTAMHAMKFSSKLMEKLGKFGPVLGVFGGITGMLLKEPSADDILKSVNNGFKALTEEVNTKMNQLEGYIDSSIAALMKKLIDNKYKKYYASWLRCIEEVTAQEVLKCQRDAVADILTDKASFMDHSDDVNVFAKNKAGTSFKTVRSLEAHLLAFRDYLNLYVMAIVPLIETYCDPSSQEELAAQQCNRFAGQLEREMPQFVQYTKNAISYIKAGHWGKERSGACMDTVSCSGENKIYEGFWNGVNTVNQATCKCEIESSNSKKYCTFKYTRRLDGKAKHIYRQQNFPNIDKFSDLQDAYAKKILKPIATSYQVKNHERMDEYWGAYLLNFLPSWEKTIKIAQDWKKMNVPKKNDPIVDLDALDNFERMRDSREERKEEDEKKEEKDEIEEEQYDDIEEDEDEEKNNFDQYEYYSV
jgi:hypothetical protein